MNAADRSPTRAALPIPRSASPDEVPVLDLEHWLATGQPGALVEQLRRACEDTGFFYITGHGIEPAVVEAMFDAARRYHELPLELRMEDRIDERFRRGFMPQGVVRHAGFAPDIKESFVFGLELPMDDPDVVAGRPLHGPNRWPQRAPWVRPAVQTYCAHALRVGRALLRLFALALGQRETFFLPFFEKPMMQGRLLYYPEQPTLTHSAIGAASHTDYGMLTLLAQDPIGGLELCKRDGEWIGAPYVDGTLVVNLGDMFRVWTNDRFASTAHRVINRTGRARYSVPVFLNPAYDTPVACLPTCLNDGESPRHAPMRAGDYIVRRFSEVQGYRAPRAA